MCIRDRQKRVEKDKQEELVQANLLAKQLEEMCIRDRFRTRSYDKSKKSGNISVFISNTFGQSQEAS